MDGWMDGWMDGLRRVGDGGLKEAIGIRTGLVYTAD